MKNHQLMKLQHTNVSMAEGERHRYPATTTTTTPTTTVGPHSLSRVDGDLNAVITIVNQKVKPRATKSATIRQLVVSMISGDWSRRQYGTNRHKSIIFFFFFNNQYKRGKSPIIVCDNQMAKHVHTFNWIIEIILFLPYQYI